MVLSRLHQGTTSFYKGSVCVSCELGSCLTIGQVFISYQSSIDICLYVWIAV